jgi:5-methylcytosine-specific restriction protein A
MYNNVDAKFYSKYRKIRAVKIRLNPICERCILRGVVRPVYEVHHIHPILSGIDDNERLMLATDITNMESLCTECHQYEHGKYTIPEQFW